MSNSINLRTSAHAEVSLVSIEQIHKYIARYCCNSQLCVKHLQHHFGIPYSALCDIFQREYRVLPREYIERYRIARLVAEGYKVYPLLPRTQYGFDNERTLQRAFMRTVGIKPNDWFKNVMNSDNPEILSANKAKDVFPFRELMF
ncbi:MAG: helix-turn-helix domain-containing protein [Bacteriodetes bacterium]|nr:helix-turn-helix domain-containing protein [Bacteroidota bacterium]